MRMSPSKQLCNVWHERKRDDEETNHTTLVYLGCARWSGVQIWPDWNEKKSSSYSGAASYYPLYTFSN